MHAACKHAASTPLASAPHSAVRLRRKRDEMRRGSRREPVRQAVPPPLPPLPLMVVLVLGFVWMACVPRGVQAVLPSGRMVFSGTDSAEALSMHCAPAGFSAALATSKGKADSLVLLLPDHGTDGCNATLDDATTTGEGDGYALVVGRGNCSFSQKAARAKRLGMDALVVHGTVAGLYTGDTEDFVSDTLAYDCDYGQALLSTVYSPGWSARNNNDSCMGADACSSGTCVVTNETVGGSGGDNERRKECCAWDLFMTMVASATDDDDIAADDDDDPYDMQVVYIRIQDGRTLLETSEDDIRAQSVSVKMYQRYSPWMDPSSLVMWLLGVGIVAGGSWVASAELRPHRTLLHRRGGSAGVGAGGRTGTPGGKTHLGDPNTKTVSEYGSGGRVSVAAPAPAPAPAPGAAEQPSPHEFAATSSLGVTGTDAMVTPAAVDLTVGHTIVFILFASGLLILLYYVNLRSAVVAVYCIASTVALATILWRPLIGHAMGAEGSTPFMYLPLVGHFSPAAIVSGALGITVVNWWLVTRSTSSYNWALQDLCGACLCVLFLKMIRFSSIRVAAYLLVLAFLYDIFFVFISPYLFESSVMISVATGSSSDTIEGDPDFCEKYPNDSRCSDTELPMLLLLPKILDYSGGYTMLGLGDIVLPGLLVAFTLRFDRIKRLHRLMTSEQQRQQRLFSYTNPDSSSALASAADHAGYFPIVMAGYAKGLLLASLAVVVTNSGQPALLYLVPLTLGLLCGVAYLRGELQLMWNGIDVDMLFSQPPPTTSPHSASSSSSAAAAASSQSQKTMTAVSSSGTALTEVRHARDPESHQPLSGGAGGDRNVEYKSHAELEGQPLLNNTR